MFPQKCSYVCIEYKWESQSHSFWSDYSIMCHLSCFNVITYRKVKKPIVKKWCYTPSENDGISTFNDRLPQPGECPPKCKKVLTIKWDYHLAILSCFITGSGIWPLWPELRGVWVSVRSVRASASAARLSRALWEGGKLWWAKHRIIDKP